MGALSNRFFNSLKQLLKGKTQNAARAPRIPVQCPLFFRPLTQHYWSEGIAYNISSSGILFRADREVEAPSLIHMKLVLPVELAGKEGTEVTCWGQIVRTVMPYANDGQPRLAAKILDYLPGTEWKPGIRPIAESHPNPLTREAK